MAKHMLVDEGLGLLNKFLLSNSDRLKYASKARAEYHNHCMFGNCPDKSFKKISCFIDKLIKKGES